jgi:hypothetical protein
MTDDPAVLRRRAIALAAVNLRLHEELEAVEIRREGVADPWVAQLQETGEADQPPFLIHDPSGKAFVVEDGRRRPVASGTITEGLERLFGARRKVTEQEVATWAEGPPVEVLEGPEGPPFVVIGGRRLPVRGLPLPHPVSRDVVDRFEPGDELDIRPGAGGKGKRADRDEAAGPLPTFLIIGAQKSATRWLRANLGQHPAIYAAPSELEFFNNDDHYERQGVDWYRAQFGGWKDEAIVGEATPGYMMWRHQPEIMARRVRKVVPDVRLIAILRNPVDRAYSAMVHHQKRERLPADASLLDLVHRTPPEDDFLGLIAGGWYAASLRPYIRLFGEQLLVLLHDETESDATGVYARSLTHVGADPAFVPEDLQRIRFSNQQKRPAGEDPLSLAERAELFELFRDDVRELSDLLDRDLSSWDPT